MSLTNELKSHFLNLYHIALSNYEVDVLELEMLYRIGEEHGVSPTQIQEIVLRPDIVRFSFPETDIEKIKCLYDFAKIIWADGTVHAEQRRVFYMFCSKFGFVEDNIPALVQFLLDEAEKGTSTEQLLKIVSENM